MPAPQAQTTAQPVSPLSSINAPVSLAPVCSSEGAATALEVKDLRVSYKVKSNEMLAVDDVSFTVGKGSFLTLVGPSGCGKSTVLNAVAGFVTPTAGTIRAHGELVTGPGPDRAVVHQQTAALLPWLSVEENVGIGLRAKGVPKRERKESVEAYLEMVGLPGTGNHAIYELSGGMQQRVAIARALAVESEVILLDEPLGAVDALQRGMMQDLLLRIWHETGRTFLLITHSVDEAVYLSTDVIVMSARPGRLIAHAKTPFSRRIVEEGGASVKRSPEFVEASADLLDTLLNRTNIARY